MRSQMENPCPHRAVAQIRSIPFCEGCAREQQAYFAVGELTREMQSLRGGLVGKILGKTLGAALDGVQRERTGGLAATRRLTRTR